MSVDYYAYAVIGVQLPGFPRAKKMVRIPAFSHDFEDDGQMEFDPKTGRKLWSDEKVEIEADYTAVIITENDDRYWGELAEGQKHIRLPKDLSMVHSTDNENVYIGFVVKSSSCEREDQTHGCRLPDIENLKETLKNLLEPYELWREDLFGLHSVLYCSY